jgi:DNA-binding LytR/AlgR family response regulator
MKTLIIEDESLAAKFLHNLLVKLQPDVEVLATLSSIEEAVKWFSSNPAPDLAFMDIQLADGVSFEIFNRAPVKCPVVFTTAYDEYAIRAFKVNSVDYLLKPIDENDLRRALDKYKNIHQGAGGAPAIDVAELVRQLREPEDKRYKERFMVRSLNALMPVPADQVAYFIKDELVYLVTLENKRYVTDYATMEEIEHFVDPARFFRANRQYVLQLTAVESLKSSPTGKVIVKLKPPINATVDVSREKASALREWIS